ncbi:hypothetical protein F4824DRAFT_444340 [Ustulina deusta]|nr:hypothetical protein F4824DRAFT_444340 [Ustulina deusta]
MLLEEALRLVDHQPMPTFYPQSKSSHVSIFPVHHVYRLITRLSSCPHDLKGGGVQIGCVHFYIYCAPSSGRDATVSAGGLLIEKPLTWISTC